MAQVTTTYLNPALMVKGANAIFFGEDPYPSEWEKIFTKYKTDLATVFDIEMKALGLAHEKSETGPTASDFMQQMYTTVYEAQHYALRVPFSRKLMRGNQYKDQFPQVMRRLKFSMGQSKDVNHASLFSNARSTKPQFLMGDGQPLLSQSHKTAVGTYSNMLIGISASLNQGSLQAALIQNSAFTDAAGLKRPSRPKFLLASPQQEFNAKVLVGSKFEPGTPNNAINPLYGMFPEGYVINHFLRPSDSVFIINDVDNGFKSFEFDSLEIETYTDFETDIYNIRAIEGYARGCSDPRALFGLWVV